MNALVEAPVEAPMEAPVEAPEPTPKKLNRFSPYPSSSTKGGGAKGGVTGRGRGPPTTRHSQRIAASIVKRGLRMNSLKNRTEKKVRLNQYQYKKYLDSLPNKYLPGTNTPLPGYLTDADVQELANRVPQSIAYHNEQFKNAQTRRMVQITPLEKL